MPRPKENKIAFTIKMDKDKKALLEAYNLINIVNKSKLKYVPYAGTYSSAKSYKRSFKTISCWKFLILRALRVLVPYL